MDPLSFGAPGEIRTPDRSVRRHARFQLQAIDSDMEVDLVLGNKITNHAQ
jgi:hypothetical protein